MSAPVPGVAMPMPSMTPTTPASAAGAAAPAMNPPAIMPPPAAPTGAPPISVSIKIPNVQPGDEDTQCMQVTVPGTEAVSITRVHNTLSPGSHHFILTAMNDAAAKEAPLAHCAGFRGAIKGAPLTITQKHDDQIQLPEGIAYKLAAKQILHLELHYINTSDKAMDIVGSANLYPAPAGANLQEAAVLLVGTADINVPAHSTKESAPKFLKLPAGMDGVKFYAITGHTHRFGTRVKVSTAMGANAPGTLLYDPERFDWEAPEMKPLQPNATIPNGGGFMLQCSWNNTSDETLTWGESALKEMCFFWGYYFPRKPVVSIVIDNLDPKIIQTL
ncbi:MAG TPA: hypothetical protein VJV78_13045 [Polyangiales bacterium]|nr:hypothetical protein [Polyangiales bacterium]